jgi:hypothetical protein
MWGRNVMMTQSTKRILAAFSVIAVLMLLFPPFHIVFGAVELNMGYGFIVSPPSYGQVSATVNVSVLFIQLLVAVLVAVVACVINENRHQTEVKNKSEGDVNYIRAHSNFSSLYRNKYFRWLVFVVWAVVGLIVYILWKNYDAHYGGGFLSGFLRGAIIIGGTIYLWYWVKDVSSIVVAEENGDHVEGRKLAGDDGNNDEKLSAGTENSIAELVIQNEGDDSNESVPLPEDGKYIHSWKYIKKYNITEEHLNKLISNGIIKGVVDDEVLYVQDKSPKPPR